MITSGYIGGIDISGIQPSGYTSTAFSGLNLFGQFLQEPRFENWRTAKCFDCGKFFRVNGIISDRCPHCGAEGNVY